MQDIFPAIWVIHYRRMCKNRLFLSCSFCISPSHFSNIITIIYSWVKLLEIKQTIKDGADEVDGEFNLIKGGGAAHTKEKIVDYAAKEFIVIVDESKVVENLGAFPVPVEVIPDASRIVIQTLEDMGAECEIRMAQRKDGPVITDNGNFVIDAKFSEIESPSHLEIDLNSIPGVVENGIFSQMVDRVIVGTSEGTKEL